MSYLQSQSLRALEELDKRREELKLAEELLSPEVTAANASRVVIRYLKDKLEDHKRIAQERAKIYNGLDEAQGLQRLDEDPVKTEMEDEEVSKWIYDITMIEEMAKGTDGWTYEAECAVKEAERKEVEAKAAAAAAALFSVPDVVPEEPKVEEPIKKTKGKPNAKKLAALLGLKDGKDAPDPAPAPAEAAGQAAEKAEPEAPKPEEAVELKEDDIFKPHDTSSLRLLLHKAARREEQLESMLGEVRKHLGDLSQVILQRLKKEEEAEAKCKYVYA